MADDNEEIPVLDLAKLHGYHVDDSDEDDPVLVKPNGERVDTWRENYPYDEQMKRPEYEHIKRTLQIELLKCCLLYTSPSPRDRTRSRMPSSA